MKIRAFFLMLTFLLTTPVSANWLNAPSGISSLNSDTNKAIYIEGDIREGDSEVIEGLLLEFARDGATPVIHLINSPGGDVGESMEIGRMIRAIDAMVIAHGKCYSSCALIYISGSVRLPDLDSSIDAEIGLHRPYFLLYPGSTTLSSNHVNNLYDSLQEYLLYMRVPALVFEHMMATPPEEMKVFSKYEIATIIPNYDPVYSEIRVARSARRFGLSTTEYRSIDSVDLFQECAHFEDDAAECMMRIKRSMLWMFPISESENIDSYEMRASESCRSKIHITDSDRGARAAFLKRSILERDPSHAREAYNIPILRKIEDCTREGMHSLAEGLR